MKSMAMKGNLLLPFIFFLILACSRDKEKVIPESTVIPASSDYPVEDHFPAGSGNQPFADIPAEPDPTKSEEYRLKTIYYHFDPYKENPSRYIAFEYDNEGKIIKETQFDSPVLPGSYYSYGYQNGRLSKKSVFVEREGKLTIERYYLYSYENNKIIREEAYDPYGKVYTWHYLYARNRLIYKNKVSNVEIPYQYKYYYDEKGRLIKQESYRKGTLSYIRSQTYDAQDRIITQQGYVAGKVLDYSAEFKYSSTHKKPSEEVYYDKDNAFVNRIHWTYTKQGFALTKWHEDVNGLNPLERNTYRNGVMIESRRFDKYWNFSESTRTVYEYERI